MRNLLLVFLIVLLSGCSVKLTPEAQKLKIIEDYNPDLVQDCRKIGTSAGSSLNTGNYAGIVEARIRAKNRAAEIQGADTFAIVRETSTFSDALVSGYVFNCSPNRIQATQWESGESQVSSGDVFEKAKKCQEKGGVWVNNNCVLKVE